MAIGFPASSKWSHTFGVEPTLLRQLVRRAVEKLGWAYETSDAETIVARLPVNLNSWGETVTIRVDASGSVDAESLCAFPWQIVDWGKNRANLNELHLTLLNVIRNSQLDTGEPSRAIDAEGTTPLERAIRSTETE